LNLASRNSDPEFENAKVTRAAGTVGVATLLSRVLGYIRDMALAWFFGAGFMSDAFFVAFRIPNLLRRLFAEGSLTIAFIPVFSEYLARKGRDDAFALAGSCLRVLAALLAAATVIGIAASPWIVRLIAPGFLASPEKFQMTVLLTRLMFPYIFFIGLVALCMGILNALGHFAAPALAPVLLNLSMIGSLFFIAPSMREPVTGLALGVVMGGVLQLLLQLPFLVRTGFRLGKKTVWFHPGLRKIGALMLPAVFGGAVYQINLFVSTLLASLLPEGSVSYLYYADRLVQFPLGIFAISLATAVLPSISRQCAAGDTTAAGNTFSHAMRLVIFITVPSMLGLIVLREPIVATLFERGAFTPGTTQLTAQALLYYCIGLWAFSALRIVVSMFYAFQDARTPVRMGVISILANIVFGILLMKPLGHSGLALATSLAAILNLALLMFRMPVRLSQDAWKGMAGAVLRTTTVSVIMAITVKAMSLHVISGNLGFGGRLIGLSACIGAGLLIYGAAAHVFRFPELETVLNVVYRKEIP
jgi:putative peptidoglycan lipid II flippase